eukprot:m.367810 g.367810  ORF g.367810 m.367810 type:complete len:86 (-) comp42504_c0_seq1:50-307(-)
MHGNIIVASCITFFVYHSPIKLFPHLNLLTFVKSLIVASEFTSSHVQGIGVLCPFFVSIQPSVFLPFLEIGMRSGVLRLTIVVWL